VEADSYQIKNYPIKGTTARNGERLQEGRWLVDNTWAENVFIFSLTQLQ
jgi:hypothetical protein